MTTFLVLAIYLIWLVGAADQAIRIHTGGVRIGPLVALFIIAWPITLPALRLAAALGFLNPKQKD